MNPYHLPRRTIACIWFAVMSLPLACHAAELSGRITAADGITPLEGIEVQARIEENLWYGEFTDSNGEYLFENLPPGSYRIRIEDNNLNTYLPEWYDNAPDYANASPFNLLESDVETGINASLTEGGRVIGTIFADSGGAPLANIRVAAFRATNPSLSEWQEVKSRLSLSDGSYNLGGLENGTYRLRYSDDAGNYAPEHHDNEIEFDNADSLIVAAGSPVSTNASLANASKIQGTVTDEGGTNPLAGIFVYAYRNNGSGGWNYVNQTTTQPNGSYDLKGLTTGDHRIQFYDASGFYQSENYDDETNFGSAAVINLGIGVTLTGYHAELAAAGRIEGTITNASGTGIPNIDVTAYRWNTTFSYWEYASSGYTDGNGFYRVGGLGSGGYKILAYDNSRAYEEQYYTNSPDIESADEVLVTVGSTTSGIDLMLEEFISGSISGTLTSSGNNPLTGIEVRLLRYNTIDNYWQELQNITTDGSGNYRFDSIAVGTYRLRYLDPNEAYASEYHSNAYTVESALDVEVTAGNETVVNEELAGAASISGTVRNNFAAPTSGIWVTLYREVNPNGERQYLSSQVTVANGTYSFGGLAAGRFFVEFADYSPTPIYAREYYNGKPTFSGADPVNLVEGQNVILIDASLDLVGQISGVVTADVGGNPIQFVSVTAYRFNEADGNWDYTSNVSTNSSGLYLMQGLTPGFYRVQFSEISGSYLPEYYNDKATLLLADSISVTSGNTTSISTSLATASRIEGTVTGEGSGAPLPNISVFAFSETSPNSFQQVSSATTNQNGYYSLGGLAAGTYQISFNDPSGYYLSEVYDNATGWLDTGTDIVVAAASTTTGKDAELIAGGKISGTVSDAVSQSAVEDIGIYFYRYDGMSWQYQNYAATDSAGGYTSPALPIGQYRVEFYDNSQSLYRSELYDNTYNADDATSVTVDALQTTGSINAALSPINQSNTIAGSITNENNTLPLAGIRAQAYLYDAVADRYEFKAGAISDSFGRYLIEDLPSGTFRIRFSDPTNGTYAEQFYYGASTLNDASDLSLGTQASVNSIDASMQLAKSISGTVRNELADGIAEVSVFVSRWEPVNNEWFSVNSTETQSDGTYTVNGLPEGTYRVEFRPIGESVYFGEFYDDVQTINAASDLYLYQFFGGSLTNIDAELSGTPPVIVIPVMSGFRNIGPGSYEADFHGQPGTMYRLERSATMLPLSWVPDGAPFEAQSGGDLLNMSSTEPSMFWRVREE